MPEISRFYGIVIAMYHNDHEPAHFHVRYSGSKARIALDGLRLLDGRVPPRVHGLVIEWARLHAEELYEDWRLARLRQPLKPIEPLE